LADSFQESITAELGVELPAVDLDAIYAAGPNNLAALQAAGFDPTRCE
jgi:hypothetical protein